MVNQKIKDGFVGQQVVVLPKKLITAAKTNPLTQHLYLTDIGYFPLAENHWRKRNQGCGEYVLIYCQRGRGVIKFKGEKINLIANSFFILPPKVAHHYYADQANPWSIYWLHFAGQYADYFYEKFMGLTGGKELNLKFKEELEQQFSFMIEALQNGYVMHNIEFVNLNLWQLISSFLYQDLTKSATASTFENDSISNVIVFMKKNIEDSLKIDKIAAEFGYSSSHFYNLFKQKTGYSPLQYFNYLKAQKACDYLTSSKLSIKEISFALGLKDQLYFSRMFKKILGISPQQYRSLHQ
ncbi:MAG TPA: AraC family transcriptional regulator [Pedobacter sp.]|nr:AraC family transcriptional regulator [Pedobacter sp.]